MTAPAFTDRQRQVVLGLAAGLSDAEIASELGITARTVKAHKQNLGTALGVPWRRIPAAYYAATGDDPWPRPLAERTPA